jgi:signal transduction histidine kinase
VSDAGLPVTRAGIGTATARLTRVLYAGAALTGLALVALAYRSIIDQAMITQEWWQLTFGAALIASPVALLLLSWAVPVAALRVVGLAIAGLYAVALTLLPWAETVAPLPGGSQPWMINLLAMACLAAATALPSAGGWAYLVIASLGSGVARFVTDGATNAFAALQDTLFNGSTTAIFVAIVIATVRAAARRDVTADRIERDAIARAAAEAEYLQRAQVAALLHDEVLSTLIAAARSTPASAPLIRSSAQRALGRIETLTTEEVEGALVGIGTLMAGIRDTAESIAPDVDVVSSRVPEGAVPLAVERALIGATAEALRNSLRHATADDTRRRVEVHAETDSLRVVVSDDGPGFDLDAVPRERLGLRMSIVRRMTMLPGGAATVESRAGHGTRVELTWQREEAR